MKLVSPEIAGELLNTTSAALMTMACLRKKESGSHPVWYVSNGLRGASVSYVDVEVIERYNEIRKRAWLYFTDSLYWVIDSIEGYSMSDFSKILAQHTNDSENSWSMWMSRDGWNLPNGNCYELKKCKLFNFIRIITRWVYENKSTLTFKESF